MADMVNEQEMKEFLVACAAGNVPKEAPVKRVSSRDESHWPNIQP